MEYLDRVLCNTTGCYVRRVLEAAALGMWVAGCRGRHVDVVGWAVRRGGGGGGGAQCRRWFGDISLMVRWNLHCVTAKLCASGWICVDASRARVESRREVTVSNSRREKMDERNTPQAPSQPHAPPPFLAELADMGDMTETPPRADVDEILRRKRKAREYKVRAGGGVVVVVVLLQQRGDDGGGDAAAAATTTH